MKNKIAYFQTEFRWLSVFLLVRFYKLYNPILKFLQDQNYAIHYILIKLTQYCLFYGIT